MDLKILSSPALTVAENIALDKILLKAVNHGLIEEHFRFYQPTDQAIVVGLSQDPQETVNLDLAQSLRIPVLKRFSGGGTVLVSPQSLTFSAIFNFTQDVPRYAVQKAYNYLFDPLRATFKKAGLIVDFYPPCDLAINGRKIAGTAQAQKKNCVLIHGCLLIDESFEQIKNLLKHPPEEPKYRAGRRHHSFLCNLSELGFSHEKTKSLLLEAWAKSSQSLTVPQEFIAQAKSNLLL